MAQRWSFEQDESQQWRWTCASDGHVHTHSQTSFAEPAECFMDAVRATVEQHRRAAAERVRMDQTQWVPGLSQSVCAPTTSAIHTDASNTKATRGT